jgi:hypothetical protein
VNTMIGKTNSKDDCDCAVRKDVFFVFFIHNDYLDVEARREFPRLKPYFDWTTSRVSLGLIRCRAMVRPISEAGGSFSEPQL